MDPIVRRNIMLKHYQNPLHKGLLTENEEGYIKVRTNNESCVDDLTIMILVADGKIQDIRFDGEACAISTSACSVMIQEFIGKTYEQAKELLENYEAMIEQKPYQKEQLGELEIYDEIYRQPNRKKCALLPFQTIRVVLENPTLFQK